ncbi:hypothetical protein MMC17_005269 [Xylographa soralifera]|nr:hypothetical protein [Xylographa soralifera]
MTIDGKALDTVRLFVDIHDVDLELSMLGGFRGSKDVFQSLQQYTTVPYYESPVEGRALVAMGLARGAQWNSPDLFRIAIQPGPIPRSAIRYNSVERGTLLHGVARALGIVTGSTQVAPYGHSPYIEEGLPGWRALLRELVLGGSDLHAYVFNTCDCSELASTPFIDLLQGAGCTGTSDGNLRCQKCNQLLKIWLEELAACGVDLQEYGEKEKAIHHSIPMVKEFRTSTNRDEYVWHLSSFTFGPSPDDWYLWESEHTDNFVGEFWSIVDPPELIIPGNWID